MWRGSSFSSVSTGHFSKASGSTVWLVYARHCFVTDHAVSQSRPCAAGKEVVSDAIAWSTSFANNLLLCCHYISTAYGTACFDAVTFSSTSSRMSSGTAMVGCVSFSWKIAFSGSLVQSLCLAS